MNEILVEFIPFLGKKGFQANPSKRKAFKKQFESQYSSIKGARLGLASQNQYVKGSGQSKIETVVGMGIFVPKGK